LLLVVLVVVVVVVGQTMEGTAAFVDEVEESASSSESRLCDSLYISSPRVPGRGQCMPIARGG
jgi:hypothetical protein